MRPARRRSPRLVRRLLVGAMLACLIAFWYSAATWGALTPDDKRLTTGLMVAMICFCTSLMMPLRPA